MRKSIVLMLIATLILGALMVSCNSDVSEGTNVGDKLVEVTISGGSTSKGISAVGSMEDADAYYWYYKAGKNDNSVYRTGQTVAVSNGVLGEGGWKPVKADNEAGLTNSNLGYFSTGDWLFSFVAYKEAVTFNGNTATGTTSSTEPSPVYYQYNLAVEVSTSTIATDKKVYITVTPNVGQAQGDTAEFVFPTAGLTWKYENDTSADAQYTLTALNSKKAYMYVYYKDNSETNDTEHLLARSAETTISTADSGASATFNGFKGVDTNSAFTKDPVTITSTYSGKNYTLYFRVVLKDNNEEIGSTKTQSVTAYTGGKITISSTGTASVYDNEVQYEVVISDIDAVVSTNPETGAKTSTATVDSPALPEAPNDPTSVGEENKTRSTQNSAQKTITSSITAVEETAEKKTTVIIPAAGLKATTVTKTLTARTDDNNKTVTTVTESSSHTLDMEVKTDVTPTTISITAGQAKVAGVDLTLTKTTTTVTETATTVGGNTTTTTDTDTSAPVTVPTFNNLYVTVSTYITKGLSGVNVVYDGDNKTGYNLVYNAESTNPSVATASENSGNSNAGTGYNPTTGLLVFKTNHFSSYIVTCAPALTATKDNETSYYSSLGSFRDAVNGGKDFAGYTVELNNDVNLYGIEWTPIGTNENPFRGVFNGNNHTISNFTISSSLAKGEDALFGCVIGNLDQTPLDLGSKWNGSSYDTSGIGNNYSAVVKNLNVSGATINNAHSGNHTNTTYGESSNRKSSAAVIGLLRCAYAENISVENSTVNGYKTVGGVIGSLDGGSIYNCSTTNSVHVNGYCNVGGIVGGLENANSGSSGTRHKHSIIAGCSSYASITKRNDDKGYGYIGGIIGTAQNDSCAVVNCEVYGSISSINNSETRGGAVGGVIGQTCAGGYFVNCINKSTVSITGPHLYVGGITQYAGSSTIVNCVNYANIEANADQVAGVVAGALSSSSINYISCANYGQLNNTKTSTAVYEISSLHGCAIINGGVFQDVSELQEALNSQNLSNCSVVKLTNVTVNDTSGALTLPDSVGSITSDTKVCSTITLNPSRTSSLLLQLPNITYEYNGSYTIWITSDNSTITVPGNVEVPLLSVSGHNTNVSISGTVTGDVTVTNVSSVVNNGTISHIRFNGQDDVVFTNNNIVSGVNGSAKHSICTTSAINLTINNKGSIVAGSGNYALLFYGNSNVVFNAYSGSSITKASNMGLYVNNNGPSAHGMSCIFNVQEGSAGVENGKYYGIGNASDSRYVCTTTVNLNANLAN